MKIIHIIIFNIKNLIKYSYIIFKDNKTKNNIAVRVLCSLNKN